MVRRRYPLRGGLAPPRANAIASKGPRDRWFPAGPGPIAAVLSCVVPGRTRSGWRRVQSRGGTIRASPLGGAG
jgi:hypothetical protein